MKKNYIKVLMASFFCFFQMNLIAQNNPDFTLAPNGRTCLCPNADFGDTGTLTIDGVDKTFTKRSRNFIFALLDSNPQNPDIALVCTSGVTNMSGLFNSKSSFNQDISTWDVSNVTDMSSMFSSASSFNQDISFWDVSNVENMSGMFESASSFNQDISLWNISSVTDMGFMFYASSFNQDISSWDVSSVYYMSYMFYSANDFNLPLNTWDVSNVEYMSSMFRRAASFDQPLDNWNVSNVLYMDRMFNEASNFNQDISGWCVEQIPNFPTNFAFESSLIPENYPDWGAACQTLSSMRVEDVQLSVYPNPVSETLFVEHQSSFAFENISIYDMLGREIKSVNPQVLKEGIQVSGMKTGSYLIQFVTQDNQQMTKRFIVK